MLDVEFIIILLVLTAYVILKQEILLQYLFLEL